MIRRSVPFAALALLAALPGPALAQRDAAYAAAREAGHVGEKPDGYIGVVGTGTAALHALANDINIRRRAVYAERAQQNHATIEEYAFTSGCLLIAQTRPGEKYMAPDKTWHTRSAEAPLRDSRCP